MNASNSNRKLLKQQFINILTEQSENANNTENRNLDLFDLICLFQALGYNIRRIDKCSPENVTPLCSGKKGVRVVVTCSHSGQRCFLELPVDNEMCNCPQIVHINNKGENFLETTMKNEWDKSSKSDLLPETSKQVNNLTKQISTALLQLVNNLNSNEKKDDECCYYPVPKNSDENYN